MDEEFKIESNKPPPNMRGIVREHEANMGDAAIGNDAEDAGKTVGSDSQHVHTSPSKCVCAMKHSGECQSSEISGSGSV